MKKVILFLCTVCLFENTPAQESKLPTYLDLRIELIKTKGTRDSLAFLLKDTERELEYFKVLTANRDSSILEYKKEKAILSKKNKKLIKDNNLFEISLAALVVIDLLFAGIYLFSLFKKP